MTTLIHQDAKFAFKRFDLEIIYEITVILIEIIVSVLYFGVDRVVFFTKTSVVCFFCYFKKRHDGSVSTHSSVPL